MHRLNLSWARQCLAVLAVALLIHGQAQAFDTFWHSAATGAAGRSFAFSPDAINIMQFGNFSGPDFFGPLYDTVGGAKLEKVNNSSLVQILNEGFQLRGNQFAVRKSAIFMHFDNLNGKLNSNRKFDYLFNTLLANTKTFLGATMSQSGMNEGNKKMTILITLGGSLHMVQDFYSHSDWIHADLPAQGFPLVTMPWGKPRMATWFEVRAKLGDPGTWPFTVRSGEYPPPACDTSKDPAAASRPCASHTRFNHDNSQLIYEGKSQVPYHKLGLVPASDSDASEHQLLAVNTAAGASMEWLQMLEQDPGAKSAIEYARGWDLKAYNPAMLHDLEQSLLVPLAFSCAAGKWDGPKPPAKRAAPCQIFGMGAAAGGAAAVGGVRTAGLLLPGPGAASLGAAGAAGMAAAGFGAGLVGAGIFMNEFWGVHIRYNVVEHLASGLGSSSGDYSFAP